MVFKFSTTTLLLSLLFTCVLTDSQGELRELLVEKNSYLNSIGTATGYATRCQGHLKDDGKLKRSVSCNCLKSLYCGNMCFKNEEETLCKQIKRFSDKKRCNYLSQSCCFWMI